MRASKKAALRAPKQYDISVNESMNGVTCVMAGAKNTWVTNAKLHAMPIKSPSFEERRTFSSIERIRRRARRISAIFEASVVCVTRG